MRIAAAALAIALVLFAGCEMINNATENGEEPLTTLPRNLSSGERSLIEGSNSFAFGFLREVDEGEGNPNVFISPLSAAMALAMTMNGARGETLGEMRATLGFADMPLSEINRSYASLIELLLGLDENVEMSIANSLWLREGMNFHDAFLEATTEHYDAITETLDFNDPASAGVINAWVDDMTHGRIDQIVDEISPDAVLYLINAIYFMGDWTTQFDPANTSSAPFRLEDGSTSEVDMMFASELPVSYAFQEDASILELPYGRGAYVMDVVLPPEETSLSELVASLNEERWNGWLASLQEGNLSVHLPRFQLSYEESLNETLQALGMERVFQPGVADLSGMSPDRDDLYVNEVKQKTFLDVHEEGTEAAAVTSVEVRVTSAPPSFRVDRPFLLVLRERLSGTILFMGAIGAPESP